MLVTLAYVKGSAGVVCKGCHTSLKANLSLPFLTGSKSTKQQLELVDLENFDEPGPFSTSPKKADSHACIAARLISRSQQACKTEQHVGSHIGLSESEAGGLPPRQRVFAGTQDSQCAKGQPTPASRQKQPGHTSLCRRTH